MKKISLKEIKTKVLKDGGSYKKENITLNGNDAYRVNGKLYTKYEMIEAYKHGDI